MLIGLKQCVGKQMHNNMSEVGVTRIGHRAKSVGDHCLKGSGIWFPGGGSISVKTAALFLRPPEV